MAASRSKSGQRLLLRLLLVSAALPGAASDCADAVALLDEPSLCHGNASSLRIVVQPSNSTAGVALDPAPVVEVVDSAGRTVVQHGRVVRLTVAWTITLYHPVTGDAFEREERVSAPLLNGTANFSADAAIRITTARVHTLRFGVPSVDGLPGAPVDPSAARAAAASLTLTSDPFRVAPAPAATIYIATQPDSVDENTEVVLSGSRCDPLGVVLLWMKDVYNNTTPDALPERTLVRADISNDSLLLQGETAPVLGGAVRFESLRVDGAALGLALSFSLTSLLGGAPPSPPLPPATPSPTPSPVAAPLVLPPATSRPFDCHSKPAKLALLPGWPPMLELQDAAGLRATGVRGVTLSALVEMVGGKLYASRPIAYERGRWELKEGEHPIEQVPPRERGQVAALMYISNISSSCCDLRIEAAGIEGGVMSAALLGLRLARLHAHNTGGRAGWGPGDVIELTFNLRTDRAGFAIGQRMSRKDVDLLVDLSPPIGSHATSYSATWLSDCTLAVSCDDGDGGIPEVGVLTASVKDEPYELRDVRRRMRYAATPASRPLGGTFGAVQGSEGRLDPQRDALPDLAAARFRPEGGSQSGPLQWHPAAPFDASAPPFECECDADAPVRTLLAMPWDLRQGRRVVTVAAEHGGVEAWFDAADSGRL